MPYRGGSTARRRAGLGQPAKGIYPMDVVEILRSPLAETGRSGPFLRLVLAEAVRYGMPPQAVATLDDVAAMLGFYEPLRRSVSAHVAGPLPIWRTHPDQPFIERVSGGVEHLAYKQRCLDRLRRFGARSHGWNGGDRLCDGKPSHRRRRAARLPGHFRMGNGGRACHQDRRNPRGHQEGEELQGRHHRRRHPETRWSPLCDLSGSRHQSSTDIDCRDGGRARQSARIPSPSRPTLSAGPRPLSRRGGSQPAHRDSDRGPTDDRHDPRDVPGSDGRAANPSRRRWGRMAPPSAEKAPDEAIPFV